MRLTAIVLLITSFLAAGQPEPHWLTLNGEARKAVEAKDYRKLRDTLTELLPLLPGNPRIMYNLACAQAQLGNKEKAYVQLNALAGAGLIYDFKADADFRPLLDSKEFTAVLERVEENRKPVSSAEPVSRFDERDLLPEDIAYDSAARRFLIGSASKCKIVTADGKEFAKTNWPVLALRIDPKRHILWAATGWIPHCEHCYETDRDKTALSAYRLDSGELLKTLPSPVKGLLGDMTISRDGDLYLSEGIYGAVLRLKAGSSNFDRLDTAGEFPSPQTPALSADERTLYVADYVRGIAAMDLKTRAVRWLEPARGIVLSGIDGFYRYGGSFLAVQNGVNPPRLILFDLDLKKQEILEANTPGLGEPTHGTLVGDTFYFIANAGWNSYDDKGKKKPDSAAVTSEIWKIALGSRPARRI